MAEKAFNKIIFGYCSNPQFEWVSTIGFGDGCGGLEETETLHEMPSKMYSLVHSVTWTEDTPLTDWLEEQCEGKVYIDNSGETLQFELKKTECCSKLCGKNCIMITA